MANDEQMTEEDFVPLSAEVELNTPEDFARALLEYALDRNATDLFISDDVDATVVRMRHMGQMDEVRRLAREYGHRLQNHLRALGDADISDLNRPAEGRCVVDLADNRSVDVRMSVMPSVFGYDLALRLIEQGSPLFDLHQLGLLEDEQQQIEQMLDAPAGLILVAGPTGSGKTHSLYAFLRWLNDGQRKIHTLEEPVEHILPGIVQTEVNHRSGMEFGPLLHTVLRHSPDVIMLGEIRDEQTAAMAIRAAHSGQLVLATVHAQTAAGAVQTMLAYHTHPHFLASALLGIIAQRLVRRLCVQCRTAVSLPDLPGFLSGVRDELPTDYEPTLYAPRGCDACDSLGYDRLVCVPEILPASPAICRAIADGVSSDRTEQLAIAEGMRSLRHSLQLRIAHGIATAEDACRLLPPLSAARQAAAREAIDSGSAPSRLHAVGMG